MEKYKIKKTLGEGGFGKALLAERKTDGELVVIKTINVHGSKKELDEAKREAKFLESLNHRNIVQYVEDFSHKGDFCIVMEHACGGDLHQKIRKRKKMRKPLSEKEIMHVFVQICEALKECHSRNILHRDLKSQNIFLDIDRETKSIVVKLGDFGIARSLSSTRALARTQIGTPFYLSPEICNDKAYNHKTDIWALGCLLYEMCALRVPFEARDMPGLIRKIIYGRQPALTGSWSRGIKNLIAILLRKDPKGRPSIDAVLTSAIVRKYKAQVDQKRATLSAAQMKSALGGVDGGAPTAPRGTDFRRQAVHNQREKDAKRMQRRSSADDAARRLRVKEREQAALEAHQRKRAQAEANRKLREEQRQQRKAWGGPANGTDVDGAPDAQVQKEKHAQAKATEAIKAKWAAERKAFLEGGGQQAQRQPAPFEARDVAPAQAPHRDRPLSDRERREQQHLEMLKQARIQAFQDRQRIAAQHGRGHYAPSDSYQNQAPPVRRSSSREEHVHEPPMERQMSAKERKEFDKLELLKQARIAAFQDRMRMAEKHRRGGAPVQSHLRASEQQRLQQQMELQQQQERQRQEYERQQYERQQYERQQYERQQYERQQYEQQQYEQQQLQAQERARLQYEKQHNSQQQSAAPRPPAASFDEGPALPKPTSAEEEKLELLRQARIQAFQDRQRMAAKHGRPHAPTAGSQQHESVQPSSRLEPAPAPVPPRAAQSRQLSKEEEHLERLKQARIAAFEERKRLQERYQGGGRGGPSRRSSSDSINQPAAGGASSISRRSSFESRVPVDAEQHNADRRSSWHDPAPQRQEEERLEMLRQARIEAFEERKRLDERFRAARGSGSRTRPSATSTADERPLPTQQKREETVDVDPKLEALKQARIEAFEERQRLQARYGRAGGANAANAAGPPALPTPAAVDERPLPAQQRTQAQQEMTEEERKIEALKQARIEAFEERKRLHARYGKNKPTQAASHAEQSQPVHTPDDRPLPTQQKRNAPPQLSAEAAKAEALRQARIEAFEERKRLQARYGSGATAQPKHEQDQAAAQRERASPEFAEPAPATKQLSAEEQKMEALKQARIEAFEERKRLEARYGKRQPKAADAVVPSPKSQSPPVPRPVQEAETNSTELSPEEQKMEALKQARIEAFEERKRLQERFGKNKQPQSEQPDDRPIRPQKSSTADERPLPALQRRADTSATDVSAPEGETPHEKQLRLLKEARIQAFQERQALARKFKSKSKSSADESANSTPSRDDEVSPTATTEGMDSRAPLSEKQRAKRRAFALARQKRAEKLAKQKQQRLRDAGARVVGKSESLDATLRSASSGSPSSDLDKTQQSADSTDLGKTRPSPKSESELGTTTPSSSVDLGATTPSTDSLQASKQSVDSQDLGATRRSPPASTEEDLTFEVHMMSEQDAQAMLKSQEEQNNAAESPASNFAKTQRSVDVPEVSAESEPEEEMYGDQDLDIHADDVDEIPGTPAFDLDDESAEDEDNWLLEEDDSGSGDDNADFGPDEEVDSDATVEAASSDATAEAANSEDATVSANDDDNNDDAVGAALPEEQVPAIEDDGASNAVSEAQRLLEATESMIAADEVAATPSKQATTEPDFAFTSPPPAVVQSDPDTVDELRDYLEKHVGQKPLMKFYRLMRKSEIDVAATKAMATVSEMADDKRRYYSELLVKLAVAEEELDE